jgi:hypothetical protein
VRGSAIDRLPSLVLLPLLQNNMDASRRLPDTPH